MSRPMRNDRGPCGWMPKSLPLLSFSLGGWMASSLVAVSMICWLSLEIGMADADTLGSAATTFSSSGGFLRGRGSLDRPQPKAGKRSDVFLRLLSSLEEESSSDENEQDTAALQPATQETQMMLGGLHLEGENSPASSTSTASHESVEEEAKLKSSASVPGDLLPPASDLQTEASPQGNVEEVEEESAITTAQSSSNSKNNTKETLTSHSKLGLGSGATRTNATVAASGSSSTPKFGGSGGSKSNSTVSEATSHSGKPPHSTALPHSSAGQAASEAPAPHAKDIKEHIENELDNEEKEESNSEIEKDEGEQESQDEVGNQHIEDGFGNGDDKEEFVDQDEDGEIVDEDEEEAFDDEDESLDQGMEDSVGQEGDDESLDQGMEDSVDQEVDDESLDQEIEESVDQEGEPIDQNEKEFQNQEDETLDQDVEESLDQEGEPFGQEEKPSLDEEDEPLDQDEEKEFLDEEDELSTEMNEEEESASGDEDEEFLDEFADEDEKIEDVEEWPIEEEFEEEEENNAVVPTAKDRDNDFFHPPASQHSETKPPYTPPSEANDPLQLEDEEIVEQVEQELAKQEKEARTAGGIGFFLAIAAMIFTAHQMSENPDGIYASVCRLAITITGVIVKIICMPCRKLIGTGNPHYTGHMPISTVDYGYRGNDANFELS